MIIAIIVACEVAFWVVIALGLVFRYVLRRRRLGLAMLATVPLVDVVLLIATALHLHSGEPATMAHSLAAFYLGFSVAYGHRLIRWADVRFAHRFAGGPAPRRLYGAEYTRLCWGDVARTALAVAIAAAVTWALIRWAAGSSDVSALEEGYRWAGFILGIETLFAISYTVWPRRAPAVSRGREDAGASVA